MILKFYEMYASYSNVVISQHVSAHVELVFHSQFSILPLHGGFPAIIILIWFLCVDCLDECSQMLRPKQLLPLLKASQRTWLVAGSTSGTRAGDGTSHPHGLSAADDREGENGRTPSSSRLSSGHLQGVGDLPAYIV